jgi:DNA-binding NarL/FixJ family response regulator
MVPVAVIEGELTERQLKVLAFCAAGLRPRDIAGKVNFSPEVVQKELQHVREFLGVPTLPAAVAQAFFTGLLAFTEKGDPVPVMRDCAA